MNYLKTSTRLGRRMSHYKDDTSGSESSLQDNTTDGSLPNDTLTTTSKPQDSKSRRSSTMKGLSGIFTIEGRNKSSQSSERAGVPSQEQQSDSKSSEGTHRRSKSRQSWSNSGDQYRSGDHASEHMEHEVPRGRSPTLSMSNTISTAASSYEMVPSDYPTINQYQAHVWRRNLLEESIMHSLSLGYAERRRSSSRQLCPRPSKRDSVRTRRVREQAILAAATDKDLPEINPAESQENIIDRSLKIINNSNRAQPTTRPVPQQQQFRYEKNSPYQLDYNASMTNITQSFASFTLELPDHQASHIMASSVIPDLFKIKVPGGVGHRPRSRRNSRTSLAGGVAPSTRVLTGKKPVVHYQQPAVLPVVKDEDEEADSPLTPTSAAWADSVFASLEKVATVEGDTIREERLKALEVAPACAV
ncbi:hypothetical protein EDD21DRAFT_88010 [Dissophora ornata]|nr:hypothetical protein BGZ58_002539 [Dissophora ornata]KAI8605939.1 hypothetical protein EDD21DRAFT_88010 [Dissophora ornata]